MKCRARLYAYGDAVDEVGELVNLIDPDAELRRVSRLPLPRRDPTTLDPALVFDISSSPEAYNAAKVIHAIPPPHITMIRRDPTREQDNLLSLIYFTGDGQNIFERVRSTFPGNLVNASRGEYPTLRGIWRMRKGVVVIGDPESVGHIEQSFYRVGLTTILTEEKVLYAKPDIRETKEKV